VLKRKHVHFIRYQIAQYSEIVLVFVLMIFSVVTHGVNMFSFPYFENDEATYFSQALSFSQDGKLAPYTYWYDHAPFGWIFTSLWLSITGGAFTFGFSLYSARVFMFITHLVSTVLLYTLTKKITRSKVAAAIAVLFFSISPLAVYFQRRMLLDNLMILWVLLSLNLIYYAKQRLWYFMASAVVFAFAVLTKENAIFFLPVLVLLVGVHSHRQQRGFAVLTWLAITVMVIGAYPIYALLKGELFPAGSWLGKLIGESGEHVSLIGTLLQQTSRGSGLPFWDTRSEIFINFKYWIGHDSWLVFGGAAALLFHLVLALKHRASRVMIWLTLPMLIFLLRGGLVINFYVIPLIPFWCMAIGGAISVFYQLLKRLHFLVGVTGIILFLSIVGQYYWFHQGVRNMFQSNEASSQVKAVEWVKANLPADAVVVMDYGMIDLMNSRFPGDPDFVNADWYWKVDFDPDIRQKKLQNDPQNIQYLLVTQQMYKDTDSYKSSNPLTQLALAKSTQLQYFGPPYAAKDTLGEFVQNYPNGDWVALYKQNTLDDVLNLSWNSFVQQFVKSDGQVVDDDFGQTSSRNLGYTLLRAALSNDQLTFDRVLNWTLTNQQDPLTGVFYAQTQSLDNVVTVVNPASSSEADQFIAYALLVADDNWPSSNYDVTAKQVADSIWLSETITLQGNQYLVAGTWSAQSGRKRYVTSPASFMPHLYTRLAELTADDKWIRLRDQMYSVVETCSLTPAGNYLPPDWCDVNARGEVLSESEIGAESPVYGYEAFRTLWNIGIAARVDGDLRAHTYLDNLTIFAQDWAAKKRIYTRYARNEFPLKEESSLDNNVAMLAYFVGRDELGSAKELYDAEISPNFRQKQALYGWGDLDAPLQQHWAWLNTWLYRASR